MALKRASDLKNTKKKGFTLLNTQREETTSGLPRNPQIILRLPRSKTWVEPEGGQAAARPAIHRGHLLALPTINEYRLTPEEIIELQALLQKYYPTSQLHLFETEKVLKK